MEKNENKQNNYKVISVVLFILSIALGYFAVSFYKTASTVVGEDVASEKRLRSLVEQLDRAENDKIKLANEMSSLNGEILALRDSVNASKKENEDLAQKLESYRIVSGEYKVNGTGIVIRITTPEESGNNGIISNLAYYILNIVSNLNSAGAEAISINDQRYTSYTEIVPVGNFLNVNGKSIILPIEIKAIGDSRTLNSAINFIGGPLSQVKIMGFNVESNEEKNVEILPIVKPKDYKYAVPIENPVDVR